MADKEVWIIIPKRLPFKNVYQLKITLRGIGLELIYKNVCDLSVG
ncbi:MAG TPA: hypothetical protein PK962_08095 [Candidatus Saccharicenans sp.]|nr:hypothetical protein [Candidatus Saccharicenans sp.]